MESWFSRIVLEFDCLASSSDCTVKVWDVKTTDCLQTFKPPPTLRGGDASVNAVHLCPKNTDHIIVCNKTSSIYIMTLQGQVVKSFSSGKKEGGDFVAACVSPKGEWIYCVGEDRNMYCFSYQTGKLEHLMTVSSLFEAILTFSTLFNVKCILTFLAQRSVKLDE
ncbi:hypothetical protein V6N13_031820 [Hibiscus sabdariffa]